MQKLVKFDDFILKQTVNCIKGGTHEVVLPEELVESKLDYNALPLTINAMCLIGRFTPYDNGIKNLCNDLATWEQNKLPSCIVCEFGHVTTYEDCNIMSRDIDRKYILPYLNHAEGGKETEVLDFDEICKEQNIPVLHPYNFGWAGFMSIVRPDGIQLSQLNKSSDSPIGFELKVADYVTGYGAFWHDSKEWLEKNS